MNPYKPSEIEEMTGEKRDLWIGARDVMFCGLGRKVIGKTFASVDGMYYAADLNGGVIFRDGFFSRRDAEIQLAGAFYNKEIPQEVTPC